MRVTAGLSVVGMRLMCRGTVTNDVNERAKSLCSSSSSILLISFSLQSYSHVADAGATSIIIVFVSTLSSSGLLSGVTHSTLPDFRLWSHEKRKTRAKMSGNVCVFCFVSALIFTSNFVKFS